MKARAGAEFGVIGCVLVLTAGAASAQPGLLKWAVDREFQSVAGPLEPTDHFSLDVILKAPAVVDRLVSVGTRRIDPGIQAMHVVVWSDQHQIVKEWVVADHFMTGDIVAYGVDVAANKDILVAGEYRDVTGAVGVFACRFDIVTDALVWSTGMLGEYHPPFQLWSISQPAVMIKELPNGDIVVGRTLEFGFSSPSQGVLTCLDAAGNFLWSNRYGDGVGAGRSVGFQDLAIAPAGSVVPPAGSIVVVGSFGSEGLTLNVDPTNGSMLWPMGAARYRYTSQWRGIDFDPSSKDMFLAGVVTPQIDICSGPELVAGRITPGTCGSPPSSNWLMTTPGLTFIPAPSAIGFRRSISGSTERVVIAGGTMCYDHASGMVCDASTGIPVSVWTDRAGGANTYARTRDLAGSFYTFTAHTIGTRGINGSSPAGVYVSAASCPTLVSVFPDALPIECQVDDSIGVYPDELLHPLMWTDALPLSVEVYNCKAKIGGGTNEQGKIKVKW